MRYVTTRNKQHGRLVATYGIICDRNGYGVIRTIGESVTALDGIHSQAWEAFQAVDSDWTRQVKMADKTIATPVLEQFNNAEHWGNVFLFIDDRLVKEYTYGNAATKRYRKLVAAGRNAFVATIDTGGIHIVCSHRS